MKKTFILFCISFTHLLASYEPNSSKIKALYSSLDPRSISQHLAFYELYPQEIGQKALQDAWHLMCQGNQELQSAPIPSLNGVIHAIVAVVNKQPDEETLLLSEEELALIDSLAKHLPNRKLKGYGVMTESDLLSLKPEEIDIGRGLFLSQFGDEKQSLQRIKSYEAALDLIALQIQAYLPSNATPKAKIRAINDFIFFEMGFRFPPHSLYAKDIDIYTFLSSVLDSRRGVCLGVSILYLSIAQRLNLPLEMITPPGHIYVRYRSQDEVVNIETTARGVDIECEEYLGIETVALQQRNLREVIGLTYFNQAATYLYQENFLKALECYKKAVLYLEEDMQLKELMGYCYLLTNQIELGRQLLEQTKGYIPHYAMTPSSMAEDYLNGDVDADGIAAVFMQVDEKRESVLKKQKILLEITQKYPRFRDGHFALATTWMQLHRQGEALDALNVYHNLDPNDPKAEYYLATLCKERYDCPKAWEHLRQAERITKLHNHFPKILKDFRNELYLHSPE